jgi:hypothetical protein
MMSQGRLIVDSGSSAGVTYNGFKSAVIYRPAGDFRVTSGQSRSRLLPNAGALCHKLAGCKLARRQEGIE